MDYRDVTGRCSARLVNELRFRLICDSGAIPMPADDLFSRGCRIGGHETA
jgi:hypothetical protein